jgi:hypothetical protein
MPTRIEAASLPGKWDESITQPASLQVGIGEGSIVSRSLVFFHAGLNETEPVPVSSCELSFWEEKSPFLYKKSTEQNS